MKQMVRFLFYLLGILLIGYLYNYGLEFTRSFEISFHSYLKAFLIVAYPMSIGILLGLMEVISKPRVSKLEYNWVFALGAGIPLAYLTFQPLLLRFHIVLPYLPHSFNYPISGILLGFVLVSAIKGIPPYDLLRKN
ncbi:hypothetical protein [Syntrophomonas curvata]